VCTNIFPIPFSLFPSVSNVHRGKLFPIGFFNVASNHCISLCFSALNLCFILPACYLLRYSKENSKTEIEYNKTIRIRLIGIFIDYAGERSQHIGMICNWPVGVGQCYGVGSEGRPESEVRRRVGVELTEYTEEGNG